MPLDHDHCAHEHDHPSEEDLGPQDNLYQFIDRQNVIALNSSDCGSDIIKPWHQRADETTFIGSDADDQIIIRVPFTGSVRLRSILLKTGPAEYTPEEVLLFANEISVDFDNALDREPTQTLSIPQSREVGEYMVRAAKFSNISAITLFFPSSQGADSIRIYYVGFRGLWSERTDRPVITVYEAHPNISDHEKVQGIEGTFSLTRT